MQQTSITQLPDPSGFPSDPFAEVMRDGARKLIEQTIHTEMAPLMNAFSGERLEDGGARLLRHGPLPERRVMTGIGPVPKKVPRGRDRGAGEDTITFTPSICLRKAKSVEELLPRLYLKGASTGAFIEALKASLGPDAKGLSANTVARRCMGVSMSPEHGKSGCSNRISGRPTGGPRGKAPPDLVS